MLMDILIFVYKLLLRYEESLCDVKEKKFLVAWFFNFFIRLKQSTPGSVVPLAMFSHKHRWYNCYSDKYTSQAGWSLAVGKIILPFCTVDNHFISIFRKDHLFVLCIQPPMFLNEVSSVQETKRIASRFDFHSNLRPFILDNMSVQERTNRKSWM